MRLGVHDDGAVPGHRLLERFSRDEKETNAVGPSLDRLKPAFARVKKQVISGGAIMPAFKGKLTDAQITAVAKYVAANAGKK